MDTSVAKCQRLCSELAEEIGKNVLEISLPDHGYESATKSTVRVLESKRHSLDFNST